MNIVITSYKSIIKKFIFPQLQLSGRLPGSCNLYKSAGNGEKSAYYFQELATPASFRISGDRFFGGFLRIIDRVPRHPGDAAGIYQDLIKMAENWRIFSVFFPDVQGPGSW